MAEFIKIQIKYSCTTIVKVDGDGLAAFDHAAAYTRQVMHEIDVPDDFDVTIDIALPSEIAEAGVDEDLTSDPADEDAL